MVFVGCNKKYSSFIFTSGAFHVELSRTSQKDRLVHCRYSPVEAGLYTISVLWSNKHVDGSPFKDAVC